MGKRGRPPKKKKTLRGRPVSTAPTKKEGPPSARYLRRSESGRFVSKSEEEYLGSGRPGQDSDDASNSDSEFEDGESQSGSSGSESEEQESYYEKKFDTEHVMLLKFPKLELPMAEIPQPTIHSHQRSVSMAAAVDTSELQQVPLENWSESELSFLKKELESLLGNIRSFSHVLHEEVDKLSPVVKDFPTSPVFAVTEEYYNEFGGPPRKKQKLNSSTAREIYSSSTSEPNSPPVVRRERKTVSTQSSSPETLGKKPSKSAASTSFSSDTQSSSKVSSPTSPPRSRAKGKHKHSASYTDQSDADEFEEEDEIEYEEEDDEDEDEDEEMEEEDMVDIEDNQSLVHINERQKSKQGQSTDSDARKSGRRKNRGGRPPSTNRKKRKKAEPLNTSETFAEPFEEERDVLVPNEFWSTVEPYFAPLTELDLTYLLPVEESPDDPIFHLPQLGKHYTERWMHDELDIDEGGNRRLSSRLASRGDELPSGRGGNQGSSSSADEGKSKDDDGTIKCGDLTQRILAALLEAKLIDMPPETAKLKAVVGADLDPNVPPVAKYSHKGMQNLEERIKLELRSIGLLDDAAFELTNREDDEICAEIRLLQEQLREQMRINNSRREELYFAAINRIKQYEKSRQSRAENTALEELYYKKAKGQKQKKRARVGRPRKSE